MDAKDYIPALTEGAVIDEENISTTLIRGVGDGYKIARGSTSVTGTADITTGLATVVQAVVSLQDDVSLEANGTSVVNGSTAGHITVKVWKPTSSSDCTPAAATVAKTVRWIAIGT